MNCAEKNCNRKIPLGEYCAIHRCSYLYERCASKTIVPGLCAKHKSLIEQDKRDKKCKRDEQIEDDDSSSDCSSSSASEQDVESYIYIAESLAKQGLVRIPFRDYYILSSEFEDYTILSPEFEDLDISSNNHEEVLKESTESMKPWDYQGPTPEDKHASKAHPYTIWRRCYKSLNPLELEKVKKYYVESIVRDKITYWCKFIKVDEGKCNEHGYIDIVRECYVHCGYMEIHMMRKNCGCPPVGSHSDDEYGRVICTNEFYQ